MTYHERQAIVSVITSIAITALYAAYMAPMYPAAAGAYSADIFRYWGNFFLILIPVSIVGRIAVQIVFVVLNVLLTREETADRSDERDKLIELKSMRNSLWTFVLGFFVAMGSLVIAMEPTVMFILLIGSGLLSSIVSDLSDFFFYRRGY